MAGTNERVVATYVAEILLRRGRLDRRHGGHRVRGPALTNPSRTLWDAAPVRCGAYLR